MTLIELKDIHLLLGGHIILDNISLRIEKGQVVAVIGPNGAGKTVLMKIILGLLHPTYGIIKRPPNLRIGYVPQRLDFDRTFPLTVREFMLTRAGERLFWPRKETLKEISNHLEKVGVGQVLNQRIGTLSGGQLQRVLIASSLLGEPEVLILDEPSAGIDVATEGTVYNLIHQLNRDEGLTIVLVDHDLDVVYRYADQVICLNRTLLCQGIPHQVLNAEVIEQVFGAMTMPFLHHRVE